MKELTKIKARNFAERSFFVAMSPLVLGLAIVTLPYKVYGHIKQAKKEVPNKGFKEIMKDSLPVMSEHMKLPMDLLSDVYNSGSQEIAIYKEYQKRKNNMKTVIGKVR